MILKEHAKDTSDSGLAQLAESLAPVKAQPKPGHAGRQQGQVLLTQLWETRPEANREKAAAVEEQYRTAIADTVENPDTYLPRLRLLRLEQTWRETSDAQKERVLASVVSQLPDGDLRWQAANVAAVYAAIHHPEPPKQLLQLRIDLRERHFDIAENMTRDVEQVNSSQEQDQAATVMETTSQEEDGHGGRREPMDRQPTKTRAGPKKPRPRKPRLTQTEKEIVVLRTIPRRARNSPGTSKPARDGTMQTLSRRGCCWQGIVPHRYRPTLDIAEEPAPVREEDKNGRRSSAGTQTGGRRRAMVERADTEALLPEEAVVQQWLLQIGKQKSSADGRGAEAGQLQPDPSETRRHIQENQQHLTRDDMWVKRAKQPWKKATIAEYEDLSREAQQREEEQVALDNAEPGFNQEEADEAYQQYQQELWPQLQREMAGTNQVMAVLTPAMTQNEAEQTQQETYDKEAEQGTPATARRSDLSPTGLLPGQFSRLRVLSHVRVTTCSS